MGTVRGPLGPLTTSMPFSSVAVTPLGTATGFLPMRDIRTPPPALRRRHSATPRGHPHPAPHSAAHILSARFGIRRDAARGRDDDRAEAVADTRELARGRIDAAAGF